MKWFLILFLCGLVRINAIILTPTFKNNSQASRNIDLLVILDIADLHFNYDKLLELTICINNGYENDCRGVDRTVYSYDLNCDLDYPSDSSEALLHEIDIALLRKSEFGRYVVDGEPGFELVEEVKLVAQIVPDMDIFRLRVDKNAADVGPRTGILLVLDETQGVAVNQSVSSEKRCESIQPLITFARNALLTYSLLDFRVLAPDGVLQSLCEDVQAKRLTCCSSTAGATPDTPMLGCLPPAADYGVLVMGSSIPGDRTRVIMNTVLHSVRSKLLILSPNSCSLVTAALPVWLNELTRVTGVASVPPSENQQPPGVQCSILLDMRAAFAQTHLTYLRPHGQDSMKPMKSPLMASEGAFSFSLGKNVAALRHVCLLNRTAIVYLLPRGPEYDEVRTAQIEHFRSLSVFLNRSDSGFFTPFPRQTGWRFLLCLQESEELDSDSVHALRCASTASLLSSDGSDPFSTVISVTSLVHISGSAVALSPAYTPSIFHSAQVLLSLFGSIDNAKQMKRAVDPQHEHWIHRIRHVFLSTTGRDDYPWTLSLAEFVRSYLSGVQGARTVDLSEVDSNFPRVLLKEDVDELFSRRTGPVGSREAEVDLVCVDELHVFGHLELRVPFFDTKDAANRFRQSVYRELQDNQEDPGHRPLGCPACSHPNCPLCVTVLLRPRNRWLYNLNNILQLLVRMGLVGRGEGGAPFLNVVHLEQLSFRDQVSLMKSTDILISPHGAALQNLIFMQPNSAVIEIMTSPWYEPGYQPTALLCDIHYYSIPHPRLSSSYSCAFPSTCMDLPLLVLRRSLECFGMRQCGAEVDLAAMEMALWQASQAVRLVKRDIHSWRINDEYLTSIGAEGCCTAEFFEKSYVNPLEVQP